MRRILTSGLGRSVILYCLMLALWTLPPLLSAGELKNPPVPPFPLFFVSDPIVQASTPVPCFWMQTPELHAEFTGTRVTLSAKAHRAQIQTQVQFPGANPAVQPEGLEAGPGHANLLLGGDRSEWRTGLPTFGRVAYRQLYPGIDLSYSGVTGALKSEFLVSPGADPSSIVMEYSAPVEINEAGGLNIGGGETQLHEAAPEIYQENGGIRHRVTGRFHKLGAKRVGFEIDRYDPTLPLVIDPVISYSTYLGGTGTGAVTGVAVDGAGNLYATGWTEAFNFPIAAPFQAAKSGGVDAFIVKFNPNGSSLLYATYVGGSADDRGMAIAVDSSGNAYVVGATSSVNFPLASPIRQSLDGSRNAFVLKLNAQGSALVYSTYLGGSNYDVGTAITVDSTGNAYVVGDAQSVNFPVSGAVQAAIAGQTDVFLTKFSPAGALVFSTFLGGSANDHAGGVAVDSSGNVYIAGGTYSTNFPRVGAIQSTLGGNQDVFVSKISASGSQILYSTFLGGNGALTPEQANGIVVGPTGKAYVAGVTNSSNFPATAGAYQTIFNGVEDGFVCELNAAGSALVYCTYLGGTQFDWISGIGLDATGNAYAAGYTSSHDFATASGVQAAFGGAYDGFVARISPAGDSLGFSTYFGGSGSDSVNSIAVDSNGNMFVGGQTNSANLPLNGAVQNNNSGGSIGWVARLGVTAPPAQTPSVVSLTPASGSGNSVTFTATYTDTAGAASLTSVGLLLNTTSSTSYACYITYNPAANNFALANDDATTGSQTVTPGGGSQQNNQCRLDGVGSTGSISGGNLTVTYAITFVPGYGGNKSTYLSATDATSSTGWVSRGSWTATIPPPQPSADSVSPSSGMGAAGTFVFVFSDTQNASNLTAMAMLIGNSTSPQNTCQVVYDRNVGSLALLWDSGSGSDSRQLGTSTVLQNSQCSVGAASVQVSGTSQIVSLNMTFKGGYTGTKNVFLFGAEATINTGWVQRGTFTIAAGGVPTVGAAVPGSGSGPSQRFSFTFSDQGGSGFLTGLAMLLAPTLNTSNACSIVYDRTANVLSLAYDNPLSGAGSLTPGSNFVVANSQCTLKGANSTVIFSTTSVVVTVDLSFNSSWFGTRNIYGYAGEVGVNTGYVTVGSWGVTGGTPSADQVNPTSGSGSSPSFSIVVSDSAIHSNISGVAFLLTTGAPSNLTNACWVIYDRGSSTVQLFNDAANNIAGSKGIGSSATVQNSQCAIGYTVMNASGSSLTFTLNLLLKAGFSGAKTVYIQALEPSTSSGWVSKGTWTAP